MILYSYVAISITADRSFKRKLVPLDGSKEVPDLELDRQNQKHKIRSKKMVDQEGQLRRSQLDIRTAFIRIDLD